MNKEIGSTYYLNPSDTFDLSIKSIRRPEILKVNESYVSTCRSAIGICLDSLEDRRKIALLPSFTCESVLRPFLKRGYEVYPYPIGRDLKLYWGQFKSVVEQIRPSVILTHPYFGFNTTEELRNHIAELRVDGRIGFIEDMTQSMFSSFKPLPTNYHVGSIRKWMAVPDGAFTTAPFNRNEEDIELVKAKIKAFTEKGEYILNGKGDKGTFQKEFATAESILDAREEEYAMSSMARDIFAHTDIEELKKSRWMNYKYLLNHFINDTSLSNRIDVIQKELSGDVCPFHFSVFVKERRRELQQYLAKNDIYATVIWGCPSEFESLINEDARYIYDHILCFHVDQRYNIGDMSRIVNTLREYNNEN